MKKPQWKDMTAKQRTATLVAVSVQISLAATAWADLARSPAERVNGPKGVWAAIIGVNFLGPIAYFIWGRRR
ncbi:PLD nuclease N-terminal domain-containing protein [Cryobacterium tagatosivorans]|uniref:PLDc_N domain-containing protein n=1 Tax=Cryobacterium tagatosivorans TaxID=1259199 RepID=A0A4R8UFL9_9MICO|nr:PLD nuclease N-terminal domain-containing protein [Cryobacterium tagatosivorans]TFB50385.1 PLDc_N domain-containing protein [Cryobacterium tagatosivorans]